MHAAWSRRGPLLADIVRCAWILLLESCPEFLPLWDTPSVMIIIQLLQPSLRGIRPRPRLTEAMEYYESRASDTMHRIRSIQKCVKTCTCLINSDLLNGFNVISYWSTDLVTKFSFHSLHYKGGHNTLKTNIIMFDLNEKDQNDLILDDK